MFGEGSEADSAAKTELATTTPLGMLTSWYNGPNDLSWMTGWRTGPVPRTYASGRAMHLIVWTDDPEVPLNTTYGPACGRAYPLSDRFLGDMTTLAQTFAGAAGGPPLYVTLFTEFQTYACTDNAWAATPAATNYYKALKDQYLEGARRLPPVRPELAKVSLGWGGWQAELRLARHRRGPVDVPPLRRRDARLGLPELPSHAVRHQRPGHHRHDHDPGRLRPGHARPLQAQQRLAGDVRRRRARLLTDASLADLTGKGLFAMSFMDDANLAAEPAIEQFVAAAVNRYKPE